MGCHTWFYKKLEIKDEEIVPAVIQMYEDAIKFWNKFLYDPLSMEDHIQEIILQYPEINDDYAKNIINITERQIRMIKKGLCKEAVRHKYCETVDISNLGVATYIKEKGFFSSKGTTHDVFRKYGYPNDKLFSYDETISYIENTKNECRLYVSLEETKEKLKKFWEKYPDGMIDFG